MGTRRTFQRWCSVATLFLFLTTLATEALAQDEMSPDPGQEATEEAALGWPREVEGDKGRIVIYQPQVESYEGNRLESRAAVSVTPTGKTEPVFGAVWFAARLATDMDTHMATLESLEVTAAVFPDVEQAQIDELTAYLEREMPTWDVEISIDRLVASLETLEGGVHDVAGLNHDPPELIFRKHPAVLVLIDGDPILADLESADLEYVVNSAYYILKDSSTYYLKGGDAWYTATDMMGEWKVADRLPDSVQQVDDALKEQLKELAEEDPEAVPSEEEREELEAAGDPEIIVRTEPAELIQTDGEPNYVPIEGTELLYRENTESDVVMNIATQTYYVLLSGRWYSSKRVPSDQWTYVPQDEVPEMFATIPADSDMGNVRASVAGTQEAKESVLANSIPQTAEIDRATATVEVEYDGDPEFEECAEGVAYAKNTDKSVLLIDGKYWCCDEAVWFVSNGPEGPWAVADAVPEQVQDLPADCPVYNVKYVYIYDSTPETVYIGYTPGYTYSYVYGGCVVYGTGWRYRPWYRSRYYARPVTYGFGAHWSPYTGWGLSFGVSFGWLHIGWGRRCCGRGWWGPGGYRFGYRHGYRRGHRRGYRSGYRSGRRSGARAGYRAGSRAGGTTRSGNMYQSRNNGVKRTGSSGPSSRPSSQPGGRPSSQPSSRAGTGQPSAGGRKTPQSSQRQNNVYADKGGNVHRQQGNDWQKKDKGGWSSSSQQSKSQKQNLNKQSSSRSRGSQKSKSYNSNRSSSRSSGRSGGSRGGGGRSGGGGRRG